MKEKERHPSASIKAAQEAADGPQRSGAPGLAQEVAADLGTELVPTSAYNFANGEIYVRFEESVRGADVFILQSHTAPSTRRSWSTCS